MKGYIVPLVSALVICIATSIILLMGVTGAAGDSVHYIARDWTVSEATTLNDGTWQVNGTLRVTGCMLSLQNATLVIGNGSNTGWLYVNEGASLVANWSTIRGAPNVWTFYEVSGTVRLSNTTIEAFHEIRQDLGLLEAINCTFRSSSPEITSGSDLKVLGTTFYNASGTTIYWYPSHWPTPSLSIEDSSFIGEGGSVGFGIHIVCEDSMSVSWQGKIRGCRFLDMATAIYVQSCRSGSMEVANNTAFDCGNGLHVAPLSPDLMIHGNDWGVKVGGSAIHVSGTASASRAAICNETCWGGDWGIYLEYVDCMELRNVSVAGSVYGIYVHYAIGTVDVRDCKISGTRCDFYVREGGTVRLHNTTHNYKGTISRAYPEGGLIEEMVPLLISSVAWQSGARLTTGRIEIVNDTGTVLASFDNKWPSTVEIPVWRVVMDMEVRSPQVRAMYTVLDTRFYSPLTDLRGARELNFTIVDDAPPRTRFMSPLPGTVFTEPRLTIEGTSDDLGSGLLWVVLRFGDGPWQDLQLRSGLFWSVTLEGVPDDTVDIVVRTKDIAGNTNETVLWEVTVDTRPPTIMLMNTKALVNRTPMTLVLMTEPHSYAYVNEFEVPVADNGAVEASIGLSEGLNPVSFRVVDRSGGEANLAWSVTLDTVTPTLLIDSPANDSWFSSQFVRVTGSVTENVTLTIDDEVFPGVKGMFSVTVRPTPELAIILVTAEDPAGNAVRVSRFVHLHDHKPQLTVAWPAGGSYLNTPMALVRGTVVDTAPIEVSVSGVVAEVSGVQWSCQVSLGAGENLLEIRAVDAAGNEAVTQLPLFLDTVPPRAAYILVVDGQRVDSITQRVLSRTKSMVLEVSVDEVCSIKMSVDVTTSLPMGPSNMTLELNEGINYIWLDLWDLAGNPGQRTYLEVLVDTIKPSLELQRWGKVTTRDADFPVRGSTEPGCQVLVRGVPVDLQDDNSFVAIVHLEDGLNSIRVKSIDQAGNTAERDFEVELEPERASYRFQGGLVSGLVIGLVIGLFAAIGLYASQAWRRSATSTAAMSPPVAPPEPVQATPSGPSDVELDPDDSATKDDAQYPRTSVVRRRGR